MSGCTPATQKHTKQGDKSAFELASQIHIMWFLSYSTLITPIPVTSQRRGEAAVSAEGQKKEEEESYSLKFQECEYLRMYAH